MAENMPSMGFDYGNLAQLTAPRMMGHAPSPMAGLLYGQDMVRNDQALKQAAGLAQMDAMQKAAAAGEWQRGAPGREALQDVTNSMAVNKRANLGTILNQQDDDIAAGGVDSRRKRLQAELKKFEPYADQWVNSDSDDHKQGIRRMMDRDSVILPNGKRASDLSNEQLDRIFKSIRKAEVNTAKHEADMEKEGLKAKKATDVANIAAASRAKASELTREMAMKRIEAMKANRPFKLDEEMWNAVLRNNGGDYAKTIDWFKSNDLIKEQVRVGLAEQPLDLRTDPQSGAVTGVAPRAMPPVRAVPAPQDRPKPQMVEPQPPMDEGSPRGESSGLVDKQGRPVPRAAIEKLNSFRGTPQWAEAKRQFKEKYGIDITR